MTRKQRPPRLLPALAPIREHDALTFAALTTRYKCRCGNSAKTQIRLEAIVHLWPGSLNLFHINNGSVIYDIGRRGSRLIDLTFDYYLFTDTRHGFHLPRLQKNVLINEPDLTRDHELHLFLRLSVPVHEDVSLRPVRVSSAPQQTSDMPKNLRKPDTSTETGGHHAR